MDSTSIEDKTSKLFYDLGFERMLLRARTQKFMISVLSCGKYCWWLYKTSTILTNVLSVVGEGMQSVYFAFDLCDVDNTFFYIVAFVRARVSSLI